MPGALRILKCTRATHTALWPAGGLETGEWGRGDRDGVLGQVCEVSERAKKRDLLIPYLPWHCRSLSLCLPLELDPRWNPPGMSSWKLRGKNPDCTLSANVAL